MWLDIWGWTCAAVGVAMQAPQLVRLLRARTSAGLSVLMWQLNCAASIGWTIHGIRGGWWNLMIPNAVVAACAAIILVMIRADRRLPRLQTWTPMVAVALILGAIELFTNPVIFGIAVMIPLATGMIGQSIDLVRAPDLTGVSPAFTALLVLVQAMWWTWGLAAGDTSIIICATVLGLISTFNLVWLVLRGRGVVAVRA